MQKSGYESERGVATTKIESLLPGVNLESRNVEFKVYSFRHTENFRSFIMAGIYVGHRSYPV